jgi:hypothetical protein
VATTGVQKWQKFLGIVLPFAIDAVPSNVAHSSAMTALLFVETRKTAVKVVVVCVSATLAYNANEFIALNAREFHVAFVRSFAFCQTNIFSANRIVGHRRICAAPSTNDVVLS